MPGARQCQRIYISRDSGIPIALETALHFPAVVFGNSVGGREGQQ
jgi:hypothetical protein